MAKRTKSEELKFQCTSRMVTVRLFMDMERFMRSPIISNGKSPKQIMGEGSEAELERFLFTLDSLIRSH